MHWIDPDHLPEVSGNFERFLSIRMAMPTA
jgi:hypothetical protein